MIQSATGAKDFAFAAASWALAVEYVDDLQREPRDPLLGGVRRLPKTVVDACRDLAAHLRKAHSHLYERTARETEEALAEEVKHAKAEDLGKIDTFECRYVVKDRMGITGARWSLAGGEAVLRLRALKASGDFDDYWAFHRAREFERNHQALYAHGQVPATATASRERRKALLHLVP